MQGTRITDAMSGPFYYSWFWLFAFLVLCFATVAIIATIFYVTRKKQIKTINTLRKLEPHIVDMNALREKYWKLIDEVEAKYDKKQIKASVAHQQLSMLARLFFYEALGFHAEVMTLNDLKKTNYSNLVKLINDYYPDEFDTLEKGNVANSANAAREIVRNQ